MKNLTALDIRVYDYVQAYTPLVKKFSMPMYVDSIFREENVYLTFEGNVADPWEEDFKDLYPLELEDMILVGLGFMKHGKGYVLRHGGFDVVINFTDSNIANVVVKTGTTFWKMSVNCRYVHEVQHFFYDQTHKPLILNWDPKS